MKVCVYTAIAGGYDILKKPATQNIETDFYCFTDGAPAGLGLKNRIAEMTRKKPNLGWNSWNVIVDIAPANK